MVDLIQGTGPWVLLPQFCGEDGGFDMGNLGSAQAFDPMKRYDIRAIHLTEGLETSQCCSTCVRRVKARAAQLGGWLGFSDSTVYEPLQPNPLS